MHQFLCCLVSSVVTSIRVLVVSSAVDHKGWYWASDVLAASKNLTSDIKVDVLSPVIEESDGPVNKSTLEGARWGPTEMREQVIRHLSTQPADIILTIADALQNNGTLEQVDSRFIHLQLSGSPVPTDAPPGTEIITLYLTRGSYLSGIASGIYAAQHTQQITVIVSEISSNDPRTTAFIKGVIDVSQDICIKKTVVDTNDINFVDLLPEAIEGSTVVFTSLGVNNEAVLSIVSEKQLNHYSVGSVTDPLVRGFAQRTQSSAVIKSIIDWDLLFLKITTGKSASTWTIHDDDDISRTSWGIDTHITVERISRKAQKSTLFTKRASPLVHKAKEDTASVAIEESTCSGNVTVSETLNSIGNIATEEDYGRELQETGIVGECTAFSVSLTNNKIKALTEPCKPRPGGTVKLVGVGMYATTIGSVDLAGSIYVDLNLYLHRHKENFTTAEEALQNGVQSDGYTCEENLFTEDQWVEYIAETQADSLSQIFFPNMEKIATTNVAGPDGKIEALRVQGTHLFAPSIKQWPFDTQNIKISIEEASQTTSDNITVVFCHLPSHSGIAPTARFFPGSSFAEDTVQWQAETSFTCWPYMQRPYDYAKGICNTTIAADDILWGHLPNADQSCTCLGGTRPSSRYTWSFIFERPLRSTLMKIFMPPLTITLVQMGVWWMTPSSYTQRLRLCGSSLVSSVMFHTSLNGHIPPTSQVTVADRFMLVVYWCNFLAFVGVYIESGLVQAELEHIAFASHQFTRLYGILVTILAFVGFFVTDRLTTLALFVVVSNIVTAVVVSASGYLNWCHSRLSRHLEGKNDALIAEKAARYQQAQSVDTFEGTDSVVGQQEMSPRATEAEPETDVELIS